MRDITKSASMRSSTWGCCLALFVACVTLLVQPTASIHYHLVHDIGRNQQQCIYNRLNHGDFGTFEIFIVASEESGLPHASVHIEGPVASGIVGEINERGERTWPQINNPGAGDETESQFKSLTMRMMGTSIQQALDGWNHFVQSNDAKDFQEKGIINHGFLIDYSHSGEDEEAVAARAEFARQKAEFHQQRSVEDEVYEKEVGKIETILPDWIEPYQWTKPIKLAGWYRMCVTSDNDITVEMDIRSSADLGGIDQETGHVYTYEDREALDEEQCILGAKRKAAAVEDVEVKLLAEQLNEALKNQVRDYDLEATRKLMNEVNHLVSRLQKMQTSVQHRIKGHESAAKRNAKKIARSGMVETALYLVTALFQVYTVHKWLLGNATLGRA
ncbi:hypothetical protein ACHAWU_003713 [Discostella pseudostelligera]|uniref:GOLD domain-containing protein n=1 Tax=Discostella pseudostelligera TaxID=259834 RepID=A0ABD3N677_9STRA